MNAKQKEQTIEEIKKLLEENNGIVKAEKLYPLGLTYKSIQGLVKAGILDHVNEIAPYLKDKLNSLKDKFPDKIKDVRGKGLMMGMELYGPAGDVVSKLLKKGVILISAGTNIIRFVPPLVVEKEHIDVMCEKLEEVFSATE
mgnify:CR=1 FL=1